MENDPYGEADRMNKVNKEIVNEMMFNFTPPSSKNVVKSIALFFLLFFCFSVYMRGYHAGMSSSLPCGGRSGRGFSADVPEPVSIRKSLFFNPDSIAYYTAIAAREDDPRALFIAGMAAHLYAADPDFRAFIDSTSSIPSSPLYGGIEGGFSLDEADHYLLRAAELGSEDAITYIRCCVYHGTWHHFVPDNCK